MGEDVQRLRIVIDEGGPALTVKAVFLGTQRNHGPGCRGGRNYGEWWGNLCRGLRPGPGEENCFGLRVVRRSADGGFTGAVVDKTTASGGGFLSATALTSDPAGSIWVAGYAGLSSNPKLWIIRKGTPSANGSITWANSDLFTFEASARANGITSDAAGNIFVAGRCADSVQNWWATRKLSH